MLIPFTGGSYSETGVVFISVSPYFVLQTYQIVVSCCLNIFELPFVLVLSVKFVFTFLNVMAAEPNKHGSNNQKPSESSESTNNPNPPSYIIDPSDTEIDSPHPWFPRVPAHSFNSMVSVKNTLFLLNLPNFIKDPSRLEKISRIILNTMVNSGVISAKDAPSIDCSKLNNGGCEINTYTIGGIICQLYGMSSYHFERESKRREFESPEYTAKLTERDRPHEDINDLTIEDVIKNKGISGDSNRAYYEQWFMNTIFNRFASPCRLSLPGFYKNVYAAILQHYFDTNEGDLSELIDIFDDILDLMNGGIFDPINLSPDQYQLSNEITANASSLITEKIALS